jgi:hypothetical protein
VGAVVNERRKCMVMNKHKQLLKQSHIQRRNKK